MKLLEQKILYFSEGKSDKVYEIDLCESGSDLFVVNFRYGRRGANLREGTKTVFPKDYDEAKKIYTELIQSKKKKGYTENQEGAIASNSEDILVPKMNTAREETILKYLKQVRNNTYTKNWKVSRIINKALALDIKDAIPMIALFIDSKDEFEQYASINALIEFNHPIALNVLYSLYCDNSFDTIVGRISVSQIIKSKDAKYLKLIKKDLLEKIPLEFEIENSETLINSLAIYFMKEGEIDPSVLYYVYLFSYGSKLLRQQLIDFIVNMPLGVNTFKSIRYIYRASEYMKDQVFLALTSKVIATRSASYSSDYVYTKDFNFINVHEEKKKKNPSIAFSAKTKSYFNTATYKKIINYSENNHELYIQYAKELFKLLDDKKDVDNSEVRFVYDWSNFNNTTNSYNVEKQFYPKYYSFLPLMFILYGGSNRLLRSKNSWYYIDEIKSTSREEALPELWNSRPIDILEILADAKSDLIIKFALGVLNENESFFKVLTDEILDKLASHYHQDVIESILGFLSEKYKDSKPPEGILISLLRSNNEKANEKALVWMKKYEQFYFDSSDFIVKLLFTKNEIVIDYLNDLYKDRVAYNYSIDVDELADFFDNSNKFNESYLLKVNNLIGTTNFGTLFKDTDKLTIMNLAVSEVLTNKIFAISFGKSNKVSAFELFKNNFDSYINSDEETLRKAGIELIAFFPDNFLIENRLTISSYCFSEFKEVRNAIIPTIDRLIKINSDFNKGLLIQLLTSITEAELFEGIHADTFKMLQTLYGTDVISIDKTGIMLLVLSKYEFAQRLGLPLLKERLNLQELSIEELVSLSTSDILEVREMLHHYFNGNVERINTELEFSLLIFNSIWQDVIDWGKVYFEERIKDEVWTVDLLLYLADHTNKDVQAFARKMITKCFTQDKGLPFLLKLQEHPTKDMQFFVTNYLDNYAKDNIDVVLELEQFFKTSLFNINTNRASKTRVYQFLKQESVKNEQVAVMTVNVVKSILGTTILKDQSNNIDLLLAINAAFPNVETPITIKPL